MTDQKTTATAGTANPRAEIRKRIMRRLNTDEWMTKHFGIACHANDVADAVLELFDDFEEERLYVTAGVIWPPHGPGPLPHTRLVLRTAPEPFRTQDGSAS